MAADVDELVDFFRVLDSLFSQCQRSQCNRDPLGSEHCKDKMDDYILVVVAMKAAVDKSTVPKLSSKLRNDGYGTVFSSTAAFIATAIRM